MRAAGKSKKHEDNGNTGSTTEITATREGQGQLREEKTSLSPRMN
jgi:hypothetical protein